MLNINAYFVYCLTLYHHWEERQENKNIANIFENII